MTFNGVITDCWCHGRRTPAVIMRNNDGDVIGKEYYTNGQITGKVLCRNGKPSIPVPLPSDGTRNVHD